MTGTITQFGELQARFFAQYNAGDWPAALDLLRSDMLDLPHYASVIAGWEVAVLARLNRPAEACERLAVMLDHGQWLHEETVRTDPDYAALLSQPGIDDLLARLQAARMQSAAEIEPLLSIFEPDTAPRPWPLLLALHGNLGSATESATQWASAAQAGWLAAVPQSIQPSWASDLYVWDDLTRTQHQLAHHMSTLRDLYRIDPARVVLAGFSRGGSTAMAAVLRGTLPACGVIAVEGWLAEQELASALARVQPARDLRFFLVAGKNTSFHAEAELTRALLTERGYACELALTSVTYHGFPADFDAVLTRGLAFVTGN